MAPFLGKYEDDIDRRTRWWSSYPTTGFNERSRPRATLGEYVVDAFTEPRCLAKSASATSLTYIRDAGDRTFQPLRRCESYSKLSPSHALPYDSRVAQRFISTSRAAKPHFDRWFLGAYSPAYFRDTHSYAYNNFYKWQSDEPPRPTRNWYHQGLLDRTPVWPPARSYLSGSRDYFGRYVNDRARFDGALLDYVHSSYDRRPNARVTRFMTGQPGTFVNMSLALPRFQPSWHPYRIYKMNRRVIF